MNKLSHELRARVVTCLVEGNSIRATVRMTGVAKNTVTKLLVDLGEACETYMRGTLVNLNCERIQCDEIWSFVGCKAKNLPAEPARFMGDVWTWVAIDADTKLCVSFLVGGRDARFAAAFIEELASRLANRVQLTTDGHHAYLTAVSGAFGGEIDYAMLVKAYGETAPEEQRRYSPARFTSATKLPISGSPDEEHISTSYVERQNLTMRMSMRRFTRLTNGFSKKVENLQAAVALHFMHYNFVRIHQTLRVTPAMAAGVTNRLWDVADLVALLA